MKNILCYGDSNTFGWDAQKNKRLSKDDRWTGVIQKKLGEEYNIIEEGLPGRTTVWYDPVMNLISGADYLRPCLCSHEPIDMVIFMLGTNDLKYIFSASPYDVSLGMERIIRIASYFTTEIKPTPPKIFLISPAFICNPKEEFIRMFKNAEEKSKELAAYYNILSTKYHTLFCDASKIVEPSKYDGLHLNSDNQKILGTQIAKQILEYYIE